MRVRNRYKGLGSYDASEGLDRRRSRAAKVKNKVEWDMLKLDPFSTNGTSRVGYVDIRSFLTNGTSRVG